MRLALLGIVLATSNLTGCPAIDNALNAHIEKLVSARVEEAIQPYASQVKKTASTIEGQALLIEDLNKAISDTKAEFKRDLEVSNYINESYRDDYRTAPARLGADSTGYSVARTSLGPAVVKLAGITPYLDGYKIKLWIAVLTPIDLSGLKGTITWYEDDPAVLQKVREKLRKKEFTTAASVKSGRYTEVEVAVTPASATGLKGFSVSVETDQITVGYPGSRQ